MMMNMKNKSWFLYRIILIYSSFIHHAEVKFHIPTGFIYVLSLILIGLQIVQDFVNIVDNVLLLGCNFELHGGSSADVEYLEKVSEFFFKLYRFERLISMTVLATWTSQEKINEVDYPNNRKFVSKTAWNVPKSPRND